MFLEIGTVELDPMIEFSWEKCPYPHAEFLCMEMMAIKATAPAGSRKKTLFMITAGSSAAMSVCF